MTAISIPEATTIPVIGTDPFDPVIIADPFPFYKALQDAGPVVWLSAHKTYATGRFEVHEAVFKDWQNFISSGGAGLSDIRKPGAWREPGPIVEADPPQHTLVRKTMSQIISPRVIRGWRETFAVEAARLCDELIARTDEIDAVSSLAEAYVLKVFPDALGLDVDRDNLLLVGHHNFNAIGPQNALFRETKTQLDAVDEWYQLSQSRQGLIPGGFGEMIFKAEETGSLPAGTASPMIRTFLRGGMDTTISGIGYALLALAERPELWTELARDRSRIVRVFEEALRLNSPITTFFRTTASESFEFMGSMLKSDTKFQLFPGAANRDPRHWVNAESFDHNRTLGAHLAFGAGIHNCIGRMIAQLEVQSLLDALLDRVARIELIGQVSVRPLNALRTLRTLPLRLICR